jgi:hypothetical protein
MAPQKTDNLDVLIHTEIANPIAIGLAETLLHEAGIPFFAVNRNAAARQQGGNILGWWDIRVPTHLETKAREILQSVADEILQSVAEMK